MAWLTARLGHCWTRPIPGGWTSDPRNAFVASARTAQEQSVFEHVQKLLRLRTARGELRRGATEHLHVGDQTYVYRRGRTVVALNNDTHAAEVRLPLTALPNDALGLCSPARPVAAGVIVVIPPRTGCVF